MTRALISQGPLPGEQPLAPIDMSTDLAGIELPSPLLTASGCAAAGRELDQFFDITAIGAIVTKSVMLQPRSGRPTPRMAETPSGMLNSIGLQGPGIDRFIDHDLAWLNDRGARTIVSIAGGTVDEYAKLAARLRIARGVSAIEVNISCPNVKKGGVAFGTVPDMAAAVTRAVRAASDLPLIVKLSPNVTDIVAMARAVADNGADAISLINTLIGMAIDVRTRRPRLANVIGGLSGPAVKPVALRMVWQVASAVRIPVIGIGGIGTAEDAIEFLLAGASAVQVGTANFYNPAASMDILDGLAAWLREQGETSVRAVIGTLRLER